MTEGARCAHMLPDGAPRLQLAVGKAVWSGTMFPRRPAAVITPRAANRFCTASPEKLLFLRKV